MKQQRRSLLIGFALVVGIFCWDSLSIFAEQNYKKLLAGRIDLFPNDLLVGYAQIRNPFAPVYL